MPVKKEKEKYKCPMVRTSSASQQKGGEKAEA